MEVLKQIDYVGGLLSISGMVLFMAGMQWGGYQVIIQPQGSMDCTFLTTSSSTHGVQLTYWFRCYSE